jgi:hypothetical protein
MSPHDSSVCLAISREAVASKGFLSDGYSGEVDRDRVFDAFDPKRICPDLSQSSGIGSKKVTKLTAPSY